MGSRLVDGIDYRWPSGLKKLHQPVSRFDGETRNFADVVSNGDGGKRGVDTRRARHRFPHIVVVYAYLEVAGVLGKQNTIHLLRECRRSIFHDCVCEILESKVQFRQGSGFGGVRRVRLPIATTSSRRPGPITRCKTREHRTCSSPRLGGLTKTGTSITDVVLTVAPSLPYSCYLAVDTLG